MEHVLIQFERGQYDDVYRGEVRVGGDPPGGIDAAAAPLPFAAATALLLAIAVAVSVIAARTTVRRDIT